MKYRYYKGGFYEVISDAMHADTGDRIIVYRKEGTNDVFFLESDTFHGITSDEQKRFIPVSGDGAPLTPLQETGRLISELEKRKKDEDYGERKLPRFRKTVAVDVDGVLAEYERWTSVEDIGDPIPGAAGFLRLLRSKFKVLIYTTRGNSSLNERPALELHDLIKRWLDSWELSYDEIYVGQGKPIATAFIDDRAITCRPQEDADAYANALHELTLLTDTPII